MQWPWRFAREKRGPVIGRLERASLLISLFWPAPYVFFRWPLWTGIAAGAAACLCAVAAAAVFYALPEGARREHLARAGRTGGPWKGLLTAALWNGFWWFALLH